MHQSSNGTAGRQFVCLFVAISISVSSSASAFEDLSEPRSDTSQPAIDGAEIFSRVWRPNDSRSHGGDGLGPVFNDTSCVACHSQGGVGGAGPVSKNAIILSASVRSPQVVMNRLAANSLQKELMQRRQESKRRGNLFGETRKEARDTRALAKAEKKETNELKSDLSAELVQIHPGFRNVRGVVLHRFGTNPNYSPWLEKFLLNPGRLTSFTRTIVESREQHVLRMSGKSKSERNRARNAKMLRLEGGFDRAELENVARELDEARVQTINRSEVTAANNRFGEFVTTTSERNPTALFGAGLIDSIPEAALIAQAKVKHSNANVTGRVARDAKGRVTRFGWKAQTTSLYEFTVTACGVELGLQVPDHAQAGDPLNPNEQPTGLDLNQPEVEALVSFVSQLPAPTVAQATDDIVAAGRHIFKDIGCADCHVQKLASVDGIYSDLLVHDMGDTTSSGGEYYALAPNVPSSSSSSDYPAVTDALEQPTSSVIRIEPVPMQLQKRAQDIRKDKIAGATQYEWRTPPLWGVRDSAPYLHDGRAAKLEDAIVLHGGEAENSARKFIALKPDEREKLIAFLNSLVAPSQLTASN